MNVILYEIAINHVWFTGCHTILHLGLHPAFCTDLPEIKADNCSLESGRSRRAKTRRALCIEGSQMFNKLLKNFSIS